MFRAAKITLRIDFLRVTLINFVTVRPEGLSIYQRYLLPCLKGASFHKAVISLRQAWPSRVVSLSHRFCLFSLRPGRLISRTPGSGPAQGTRGALTSFVLFPPAPRASRRTTHLSDARITRARERACEAANTSNS